MQLEEIIEKALIEDLKDGDHTSLSCVPKDAQGQAKLLVKDEGVIAGIRVAKKVFKAVDPSLVVTQNIEDGDQVKKNDIAFTVEGSSQSILSAERLALNLMQRMSGIASTTAEYVKKCHGTSAKVLDTRKTTPNLRMLEKEAVLLGGGVNHRFGLYDMIMIKDNHIDFAGGIPQALEAVKLYQEQHKFNLKVEIEARNLDEVLEIMKVNLCDRIMLDNFSIEDTKEAVKLVNSKFETESSGGITLDTIQSYAQCGVDFISVGALTHSVKSLDLSLKAF